MTRGRGYTAPPMPWGLNAGELQRVRTAHPAVAEVRALPLPRGRGLYYGAVAPALEHLPAARNLRPTTTAIAGFS